MAYGMKKWLQVLGIGIAVLLIWRLPPATFEPTSTATTSHEEVRYRALSTELRASYSSLQRIRWADSLAAIVVDRGIDGVAFALPEGHGVADDIVATAHGTLLSPEEATSQRGDLALGMIYQPMSHGAPPGVRLDDRPRTETYVGTFEGTDYCFRVGVIDRQRIATRVEYEVNSLGNRSQSRLGACLLFSRHGMPGPDVLRWLTAGGVQFGLGSAARSQDDTRKYGRRGAFGLSHGVRAQVIEPRCMSGIEAACAAIFLTPQEVNENLLAAQEAAERSPAIATQDVHWALGGEGPFLLADLERWFGPEAFTRFWTSSQPVDKAFEEAFEMEAGAWVVTWLSQFMRVEPAGPGLQKSATSWSMMLITLFAGIAYLRSRRRQVG